MLTIFDKNGQTRTSIEPSDNSTQTKEVQGENQLNLSFTHYEHISLDVLDYVDFEGERYWLLEKYAPKQKDSQEWSYDLKLYGADSLIKRFLVLETTDGNAEPIFTLTATPREHAQMVLNCINAGMGNSTPWQLGQVDGENLIVIDYNGTYCNEALTKIVEAVGGKAEWWFDAQTLNICRCESGDEITLAYGNGLTELERDTSNIAKFYTRLFPIGSDRNIDPKKYGYSRLMLPEKKKYVEIQTEEYGVFDHFEREAFADIYPRRIGTVSEVRSEDVTDENGTPFTIYYFKDDSLDFDPNQHELPNETKRISFQDGDLAGMGETDDHYFECNYNSDTREFELITIWPYDSGTQLPGGNIIPRAGDHYILWNITMPDEYYTLAEQELQQAVNQYNDEHWFDLSVYKGTTDHVWMELGGKNLFLGRRVRLESPKYFPETGFRNSRITKITRKVNLPLQMDIEISDAVHTGTLEQLNGSLSKMEEEVASNGKKAEQYRKEAQDFTVRRFRDTQETIRLLEKAMLANFTSSVSPLSVHTMAALVGDESLQFRFVDNNGNAVLCNIAYNNTTHQLTAPKSILQHLTLGIDSITSDRKKEKYKTWTLEAYTSPAIISETDINKAFYLYAKVSKTENTGTYLLTDKAVAMEEAVGSYHLLIGILNSEYNGERSFVTLYGFTEILPGRITTDKIVSGDGNTYFDLAEGKICGNIKFISSSGGLKDVQQGIDEAVEGIENRNLFRFIQFTDRMIAARGKIDAIGNYIFSMTSTTDDCYTDTYTSSSKHRFIDVKPGEIYTLSLKRKNNTRGKTFVFFRESSEAATYKSNISFYEDKYTFTIPEGITCIAIRFGIESVGFTEEFYEIKLEKGDKATSWSPSPEDLQAQIDVNSGTRNWIAKKYLLDWNDVSSNITERGSDEDGDYFAINQAALYQTIGGGGVYNDIFQGKIKYKENTQYAFKIRVKMAGKQQYSGLSLYFRYTDATKDDVVTNFTSTTITEIQFISAAGKTLDKIYCSYSSNDYRTKIYDIQLTEGNKQAVGYIIAEEDIEAGIIDKVELGNGGTNMLKNGSGEFGDNTYFPNCEFVGEQYNGSSGALIIKPDPKVRSGNGSQFIPIDRKKAYRIGFDLKGVDADTALYIAFAQYDIDKKLIDAKTAMYISGTLTKLSQDLNNGDTVVHFESLSGWNVTTDRTYQKGLKFWNYANSAGYVYPPETYSRNYYQSLYTDNSAVDKANNTITLDKPWSGGTVPAGTEVSQCSDGLTHGYIMSGVPNTEWTHYETLVKGEIKNLMIKTGFNPACAFIRMWWYLTDTTDVVYMTNIFVREDIPTTDEVGGMIQDGIDGMEIGGENFITEIDSDKITLYSNITPSFLTATLATNLPEGTYVLSYEDTNSGTFEVNGVQVIHHPKISLYANGMPISGLSADVKQYVFTVVDNSTITLKMSNKPLGSSYITKVMLQRGNKPTAYQKAIQYIADAIEKGSTEINGGLLATNLFQLKGLNGVVTSGMSGLADNILLWGGGSYQQAVAETVATLLRKDGSGFFAKKKITWDKDGNLSVKEIDAVSGSIAGFEISNDRIGSDETSIVSPQGEMSLYRDMILFRKKNDLMTCNSYISSDNGGGSVALIEYEEKNNNGGATALTVRCKQEFENTDTLALHVDGNMRFIGKMSHYSTGYIGAAGSSIIRNNIKITNTFVFTSVSLSTLQVDLPTLSDIRTAAGVTDTYKITFLLHIHSIATGINKIYIRPGDSSVRMVNYNGNTVSGISLGTGNVLILRFYGNTYYQVQLGM